MSAADKPPNDVSPNAVLEAYVLDVVRRLPRRQRNDVGVELRNLLAESLRDRAADAGHAANNQMALDIVRDFGRPDDVAARYHPPGDPIIPPQQSAAFAWTGLIGIAIQWSVTLPMAFDNGGSAIGAWWVTYGLGAFWWPGFLVTIAIIAGFVRRRWPASPQAWRPKGLDTDTINRPLHLAGFAAALVGIGIWVAQAWFVLTSSSPAARALAFAPDFLITRAPVIMLYWAAGLTLMLVVIMEGRWRPLTRQVNLGLQVLVCALMAWLILGGPMFVSEVADQTAKAALGLIIVLVVIQLASLAWRRRARLRPPVAQRG
ncbi:MAG TPA: hypothetical protein VG942_12840 [Hyphomonadaceae bacterium]|nr:hypothetical protein [Hyphomonadaceae bacterium]